MKRKASWMAKKVRRKFRYQFFVSHHTENKRGIVQPVLEEMDKLELSYFIDSSGIKWGTSLHRSLSQGLNKSEFFLAFISEKYVQRKWTMLELDAALHRQISECSAFILPVLIGSKVQRERIMSQIPLLANVLHLVWEGNPSKIVISLVEMLKNNNRI